MNHESPTNHPEVAKNHDRKEIKKQLEKIEHERNKEASNADHHEALKSEARSTAKHEAISSAEYVRTSSEKTPASPTHANRLDKKHAFNSVMHNVRQDLSRPERSFSKIIHHPTVERVSDFGSKTIARPSGVTGAACFGVIGLFATYLLARHIGFGLSGSETLILIVIGFIFGVLVEWLYKATKSLVAKR